MENSAGRTWPSVSPLVRDGFMSPPGVATVLLPPPYRHLGNARRTGSEQLGDWIGRARMPTLALIRDALGDPKRPVSGSAAPSSTDRAGPRALRVGQGCR